jgi:3-methyl-2-oxobutanoate hydroxymethyltransferase
MDEMIHHAKAVKRGVKKALIIGDMPFLSYQANDADAIRNSGRLVKEGGCDAVKIEGGKEAVPRVKAITGAGIPVMGHVGLTPQSVNKLGGYKVQGKDPQTAQKIMDDALALADAGCFAVVLECLPAELAARITGNLCVPTIGIGSGLFCDGQVLVTHDLIGYPGGFTPRFVKRYADVGKAIKEAIDIFKDEVLSGKYPDDAHSFK